MYKSYLAFIYKFIIAYTLKVGIGVYIHMVTAMGFVKKNPVNSPHGTGIIYTSTFKTKLINSFTYETISLKKKGVIA